MDRRKFIATSVAGCFSLPLVGTSIIRMSRATHPIGIILNTVRKEMKADYRGTLEKLRSYGYKYLEGSYYGTSAKEYKRFTDELGFECSAGGSSMSNLDQNLDQYLETAEILGYKYIVCYYPWLVGNDEISIAASYEAVENLNRIGKIVKSRGFEFLWHPHNWEFVPRENGQRAFDVIMQHTDPEYVSLELDLYWVVKGGSDAIAEMDRYPGRTKAFHFKDMSNETDQGIACVGDGLLDFKPIIDYARSHKIDYWFVENETPSSSIECAKKAIDALSNID